MFIHPSLWLLAPLALLPVAIHLIHRTAYPRFAYSTILFFERVVRQNAFSPRVKHLPLMLLRMLMVLLLLLAFSRFGFSNHVAGDRSEAVMFVVDASASTTRRLGDETMLAFARRRVLEMAGDLGENAAVGLLVNSSPPKVLAAPAADRKPLRDSLEAIETFYGKESAWEAVDLACRRLAGIRAGMKRVVVLTDYQAEKWQREDAAGTPADAAGIDIDIVAMGPRHENNVAIAGVDRPRFGITTAKKALFRVTVTNDADEDVEGLPVEAGTGDPAAPAAQRRRVNLNAGESVEVSFHQGFSMSGPGQVWFRLPEGGGVAADDLWIEPVNVADTVSVLTVHPRTAPAGAAGPEEDQATGTAEPAGDGEEEAASETRERSAGDRGPFYLERALAADLGRLRLDALSIDFEELEPGGLYGYGAVLLTALPALSDDQVEALRGYVNRGGGLVVFLGDKTAIQEGETPGPGGDAPLLPAAVTGRMSSPATIDEVHLGRSENLRGLADIEQMLRGVKYRDRYTLAPAADATVLARFDDGTPAIVAGQRGFGHVVMIAGGLAWPQTDLSLQAVFPELIHRLVESFSAELATGERALAPGEAFARVYRNTAAPSEVSLIDPAGARRPVAVEPTPTGYRLYDDRTAAPGHYVLEAAFSRGEPLTPLTHFAVNPGAVDADLQQAEAPGEPMRYAGAAVHVTAVEPGARPAVWTWTPFRELTRLVMGVLLVLLIAENMLSWKTK